MNTTKIVLVNTWRSTHPHLGLAYIASYLTKYSKFKIEITIIEGKDDLNKIIGLKPDLIGFYAYTPNYYEVVGIAKNLKRNIKSTFIIGGPHISSLPNRLDKIFDIGVIGEAEETMLEILDILSKNSLNKESLSKIKGVCFHNAEGVVITQTRDPIKDLDRIPYPSRELLDMGYYLNKDNDILSNQQKIRGTTIITSRGCPYRCVYCQSSKLFPVARYHSASYVVGEIKELYDKYKVEAITIDDDLFVANKNRLSEIINLLEKEKLLGKIKFYCSVRANLVNEDLVNTLKKLNVVMVNIGFETGSNRLLKYLKKDSVSQEDHKRAIYLLNKNNIDIYGNFMIGNPTETKEEMLETLNFFKNNNIKIATLNITTPLPGTEIWEIAKNKGIVNEDMDWSKFFDSLDHPEDQIYINEKVPHDEFIKIFNDFRSEIIKRAMGNWQKSASLKDMLIKFFRHPRNNIRVLIKNRKQVWDMIKEKSIIRW
jgi:radical SAM superfamily enzyme YgiQ (UPF0313 family)